MLLLHPFVPERACLGEYLVARGSQMAPNPFSGALGLVGLRADVAQGRTRHLAVDGRR